MDSRPLEWAGTHMAGEPHVVGLENCTGDCAQLVGGKATGLGALLREGLQVPPGFAITTAAYREHVARTGLATQLQRLLADCTTYEAQLSASEEIRNLFEASSLSPELAAEVLRVHAELCQPAEPPVAARSSTSAEDMGDASSAGSRESELWIVR